jgi:hypothetical protein
VRIGVPAYYVLSTRLLVLDGCGAGAWGIGIGVRNAVWGGCNWWNHDVNINVNRYNNINVNNRIDRTNINNAKWSHNVENRKNVAYRGGEATRQNLDRKAQATNREQYRGRDADRQRAQQSLQSRGVSTDRAALSGANRGLRSTPGEKPRSQRDVRQGRGSMQQPCAGVDRSAMATAAATATGVQGVSNRRAGWNSTGQYKPSVDAERTAVDCRRGRRERASAQPGSGRGARQAVAARAQGVAMAARAKAVGCGRWRWGGRGGGGGGRR